MTKHDLKELAAIGAELGAAKAEIEALREQVKVLQSDANSWQSGYDKGRHDGARHRKSEVQQLRGLLRQATELIKEQDARLDVDMLPAGRALMKDIRAALSQQADPTDTYTAVDMATAAAQGFRDGQAAVEQATAQDEQQFMPEIYKASDVKCGQYLGPVVLLIEHNRAVEQARATRPAQTEQQAVRLPQRADTSHGDAFDTQLAEAYNAALDEVARLNAAPIAQTAPPGKFRMGDLVRKTSGSEWQGRICGTYSTSLTPEGYAVESEAHAGSVQIYPAKALEAVE